MIFVLATSSAKALSRKTTLVSPAGASSLCQSAMPWASGSISFALISRARQAKRPPTPTLYSTLPAMVFCNNLGPSRLSPSIMRFWVVSQSTLSSGQGRRVPSEGVSAIWRALLAVPVEAVFFFSIVDRAAQDLFEHVEVDLQNLLTCWQCIDEH